MEIKLTADEVRQVLVDFAGNRMGTKFNTVNFGIAVRGADKVDTLPRGELIYAEISFERHPEPKEPQA